MVQVARAGVACRGVVQLTGPGLDVGDQGFQVGGRYVFVHHKQAGHTRQQGHGHKVLVHVVTAVGVDQGVDRHQADVAHDDGVAVCCGTVEFLHGGHTATATFVVGDKGHAHLLVQLSRNTASHDARGATRRKGDDPTDGFVGPSRLGMTGYASGREAGSAHPFEVVTPWNQGVWSVLLASLR